SQSDKRAAVRVGDLVPARGTTDRCPDVAHEGVGETRETVERRGGVVDRANDDGGRSQRAPIRRRTALHHIRVAGDRVAPTPATTTAQQRTRGAPTLGIVRVLVIDDSLRLRHATTSGTRHVYEPTCPRRTPGCP